MKHVNGDMDDLFRRASEKYPLRTDRADWDRLAAALDEDAGPHANMAKDDRRRRRGILWWLLLLPLGGLGYFAGPYVWHAGHGNGGKAQVAIAPRNGGSGGRSTARTVGSGGTSRMSAGGGGGKSMAGTGSSGGKTTVSGGDSGGNSTAGGGKSLADADNGAVAESVAGAGSSGATVNGGMAGRGGPNSQRSSARVERPVESDRTGGWGRAKKGQLAKNPNGGWAEDMDNGLTKNTGNGLTENPNNRLTENPNNGLTSSNNAGLRAHELRPSGLDLNRVPTRGDYAVNFEVRAPAPSKDSNNRAAKQATARLHKGHVYIGVIGAPDLSSVKMQSVKGAGTTFGILLGYAFNDRWAVETGVYLDEKKYYTEGEYFKYKGRLPPGSDLEDVNGTCHMWEIPLNVRYNFTTNRRMKWFATAGLSTYLMSREYYDFDYETSGLTGSGYWDITKPSQYWFSIVNISGGFEQRIGKIGNLRVEPYLRLPLSGIGTGGMPIMSAGLNIGITRQLW